MKKFIAKYKWVLFLIGSGLLSVIIEETGDWDGQPPLFHRITAVIAIWGGFILSSLFAYAIIGLFHKRQSNTIVSNDRSSKKKEALTEFDKLFIGLMVLGVGVGIGVICLFIWGIIVQTGIGW